MPENAVSPSNGTPPSPRSWTPASRARASNSACTAAAMSRRSIGSRRSATSPSSRLRSSRSVASRASRRVWRPAVAAPRRALSMSGTGAASDSSMSSTVACRSASGVRSSCEAVPRKAWRERSSACRRARMDSSARARSPTSSCAPSRGRGSPMLPSPRRRAPWRRRSRRRSRPKLSTMPRSSAIVSPAIAASGSAPRMTATAARLSFSGLVRTSVTGPACVGTEPTTIASLPRTTSRNSLRPAVCAMATCSSRSALVVSDRSGSVSCSAAPLAASSLTRPPVRRWRSSVIRARRGECGRRSRAGSRRRSSAAVSASWRIESSRSAAMRCSSGGTSAVMAATSVAALVATRARTSFQRRPERPSRPTAHPPRMR